MVALDKSLQWRRVKQKPFCHIKQVYSQAYSEPSVTLAYLEPWYVQNQKHIQSRGIFRVLAYKEPRCIQNPGIFRTLAYSEPCQTSTMEGFPENN